MLQATPFACRMLSITLSSIRRRATDVMVPMAREVNVANKARLAYRALMESRAVIQRCKVQQAQQVHADRRVNKDCVVQPGQIQQKPWLKQ
jgi:hypothetical protein